MSNSSNGPTSSGPPSWSVSHDLRTPLATIRAAASDLRASVGHTPEVHEELLDMVCDEAERLDRIVANLLNLSRRRGRRPPARPPGGGP